MAGAQTVAELGEHALLKLIAERVDSSTQRVGIGDDAAVVSTPSEFTAISTDVLVADEHFRLAWSTPQDIGARVAAASLADVAAMGAQPTALVVSLVLPGETTVDWTMGFLSGVIAECDRANAVLVGGDVSAGSVVTATGTAMGDCLTGEPITRGGAQVGDVVAVAGVLGWSAAGLAILSRGFSSPRSLVQAFRRPVPPYESALAAAEAGAHAMIDVSDGLLADVGHIAQASNVSVTLKSTALAVSEELSSAAAAFNFEPLKWVLTGGEDHSFVATFADVGDLPPGFQVIGSVVQAGDEPVLVDGHAPRIAGGFDHFRSAGR